MNAYRAYDVIEERKWAEQTLSEEKEKWIEDRAKEVFDSLPEDPYAALRQSASSRAFPYEGLRSDKAGEVYNDLRTAIA
ncbi:host nuclease inhibitor GamL, partial [Klebsiella pneumoniae]